MYYFNNYEIHEFYAGLINWNLYKDGIYIGQYFSLKQLADACETDVETIKNVINY